MRDGDASVGLTGGIVSRREGNLSTSDIKYFREAAGQIEKYRGGAPAERFVSNKEEIWDSTSKR